MRMRRKKNLEQRLADCSDYLIPCQSEILNFQESGNYKNLIDTSVIFGNGNPVVLEIGCGKGGFACAYAKQNPNVNVIAVEKTANVIVTACETAKREQIPNLRFMKCGAEYLESFLEEHSVEAVFLNFSCPFPKKKYAKHRLTNERFLNIYEKLLKAGAPICQKTDNQAFFEYSIEELSRYGFVISNVSLDLHNSDFQGNIVTEYEKRFSDLGMPIYRLEARLR